MSNNTDGVVPVKSNITQWLICLKAPSTCSKGLIFLLVWYAYVVICTHINQKSLRKYEILTEDHYRIPCQWGIERIFVAE